MSIRTKMILVISIILLGVTISISTVWYTDSTQFMDKYVQTTGGEMMENASNNFSYILTDTKYMSSMISMNNDNIIEPLNTINKDSISNPWQLTYDQLQSKNLIDGYIDSMYGYKYYVTGISIISTSGFESKIGSVARDENALLNTLQQMNNDFENKSMVILSSVPSDINSKSNVIPLAHSIKYNQQIIGYVVICFDYAMIKNIFSTNLPQNSKYEICDSTGKVIFTNCDKNDTIFSNHEKGYVYNSYNAENIGWNLEMAIPFDAILANINQTVYRVLSIFALVYIIAIVVSICFVYGLTSKLKMLSNAMNVVSAGDLTVKTQIHGNDEIEKMNRVFNQMVENMKMLMEQNIVEEKKKREVEIDFLQAQINPHFISNTLNTISWMAQVNNSNNIRDLTNSLITLLQSSMRRGVEFISIQDEVEYIKCYIDIINCCGSYEFDMGYSISDEVRSLKTLRFVLQPIVENAIIHGIADLMDREGKINILAYKKDEIVCIEVSDNGKGMTSQQIENIFEDNNHTNKSGYSRIGIKNVNDRIQLFFGNNFGISFESIENKFTTVRIILPVIE